jgi:hypothetical protein
MTSRAGAPIFDDASFVKVLNLYYNVVQSLKGYAPPDSRLVRSHGLAAKLFEHAASAFWLSKGTRVPELPDVPVDFFDHGTVTLIARAALETYLVFYYIFLDPRTEDEFEFRFNGWMLAGLAERERHPFRLAEHQAQLAAEKPLYESFRRAIRQTKTFKSLGGRKNGAKTQQMVLKGRKWRFHPWREIAVRAGFGPEYSQSLYAYLSDYAHSGSLAALQVGQAQSRQVQVEFVGSGLRIIMVVLCKMIAGLTERFPKATEGLETDPEARHTCEVLAEAVRRLE